jgi:hypothetical protein
LCLPAPLPQLAAERGRQSKHPPSPPPQDARPARAHTLPPTDMGVTVSTWPTCHPHHPASSRVRGGRRIPWGLVGPRLLTGQIRGARAPDRAPPPPTVRPPGRPPPTAAWTPSKTGPTTRWVEGFCARPLLAPHLGRRDSNTWGVARGKDGRAPARG